jgi:hypothetical protein
VTFFKNPFRTEASSPGSPEYISVQSCWIETIVLGVIGGLLLLLMTLPAFRAFFFAENFEYLGQYQTHSSNFWQAILSPTNRIFFRPVFYASSLPWHFLLPLEPWAYHLRNFAFSLVNIVLLHRVLVRLVASRYARALALLFFALSKIHLTTIGYINIFDSIVMLMILLLAILFFARFIATERTLDYALGLLFGCTCIFTKDFGLVGVFVLTALVASYGVKWSEWKSSVPLWMLRLAPLFVMVAVYLWLRYSVVGGLPTSDGTYAPQFSFQLAALKLLIFSSTLGNLAFFTPGITGASGLGSMLPIHAARLDAWFLPMLNADAGHANWTDALQFMGLMALLAITIVKGFRRRLIVFLFPIVWIAVYLGPTLLTRNIQLYYNYEAVAGTAVLLGLLFDQNGGRLLRIWSLTILLIFVNGFVSNYKACYAWQFVSGLAQKGQNEIAERYRQQPVESITFVSAEPVLWQFALGKEDYPFLHQLMHVSKLNVHYIHHDSATDLSSSNTTLVLDADHDFRLFSGPGSVVSPQPTASTVSSEDKHGAKITATPNPVPTQSGTGTSAISWNTGDGSPGSVYVSVDNGPEELFADGSMGSSDAGWIKPNVKYEFRLYSKASPRILLASVQVTGN